MLKSSNGQRAIMRCLKISYSAVCAATEKFQWLRRLFSFLTQWTIACLLLSTTALAQSPTRATLRDLDGGKEFVSAMTEGVSMRIQALDESRLSLAYMKCTARDLKFPGQPAPRIVAVAEVVLHWMLQGGEPGTSDEEIREGGEVLSALLETAFSPEELMRWDAFRRSAQGRRSIAVHAVRLAANAQGDFLSDSSSGTYWAWPLANLRDFADSQGLREPLYRALEEVRPGSTRIIAGLSAVPGVDFEASELAGDILRNADKLAPAFERHLSAADVHALRMLEAQPVFQRWSTLLPEFSVFLQRAIAATPSESLIGASEFCRRSELARCDRGFLEVLQRYLATVDSYVMSTKRDYLIRQIVRDLPEAGCPSR